MGLAVGFACVVVLVVMYRSERYTTETPKGDTIFVSIPAYRDQDCAATVLDLFRKAKRPERVFAGMCVQTTGDDIESCLPKNFKWHANVRIIRIPHTEAKGPTYARALCASLWRGETWFLGIDAHSKWAPGWDEFCVREVKKLPPKSILSHYPPAWDEEDVWNATDVPHCHKVKFDDNGAPALEATRVPKKSCPRRTPYVTGGFTFAPGQVAKLFDPGLDHLWVPEEFLLSARLYTHGYDVYTPSRSVVSHFYERKHSVRWNDDIPSWHGDQKGTLRRVLDMLDPGTVTPGEYGMGNARPLQDYYDFCGVDWYNKRMMPGRENTFA